MDLWIFWLILAAVLMIVEVLSQTMWSLCMAIGCLVAMLASLFVPEPVWQIAALAVGTALAYIVIMPWFRRWHIASGERNGKTARTGMDALLGRKAFVTHEIKPGHIGRARIDGDNWQVVAPGVDCIIDRGTEVVVTGYDSIILQVARDI